MTKWVVGGGVTIFGTILGMGHYSAHAMRESPALAGMESFFVS
jgi:hypothetical protein